METPGFFGFASNIDIVKATLKLKLHTDAAASAALRETLRQHTECFNAVCRYGWDHSEHNAVRLHQSTYRRLREEYTVLPSQLVISARTKASEALKPAHKRRKQGKPVSCPHSNACSIRYDACSYWVKLFDERASLATVCGRIKVCFRLPKCYDSYLSWRVRSADLCYDKHKKCFYLHVCVDKDAPDVTPNRRVIGCDMGVRRVAVTSGVYPPEKDAPPQFFSSARTHSRVRQHQHLRSALQRKGTKSAKRHLRRVSRRWTQFQRSENHITANNILAPTQVGDTLAIEELTGIRDRCKHRKQQRGLFHSWSFAQLGAFMAYKAERKGILLIRVDPRNSSRICNMCGSCDKANRQSQSNFACLLCGYAANADYNAANNLRLRGITSLSRLLSDSQSCRSKTSVCDQAQAPAFAPGI